MSKDKEECRISTNKEKEIHVQQKVVKKDEYYVASSNESRLIITHVQLKENFKDNNYAELAKVGHLALRLKKILEFIDSLIPIPEADPTK